MVWLTKVENFFVKPSRIFTMVFLFAMSVFGVAPPALAGPYWPETSLSDWGLLVNNGVVYISSQQMASHCTYSRAEIHVSDSAYDRALYAYALSAKARGKSLRYVIDSVNPVCVIGGLQEF